MQLFDPKFSLKISVDVVRDLIEWTSKGTGKTTRNVIRCRKCPRLVVYLKEVSKHKPKRYRDWDYWSKPLPSFGDPNARLLIIGLAPAANGGNRTGRMFTGDRSGEWLFGALLSIWLCQSTQFVTSG